MRKIKKMRNDSCRKKTVTTVTVTEMGMKSTQRCILQRRVCHKSVTHPFFVCVSIYSS